MKHLRRYLCVLLCLVLSLGVFSVGVSAASEKSDLDKYSVDVNSHLYNFGETVINADYSFTPRDGVNSAPYFATTIISGFDGYQKVWDLDTTYTFRPVGHPLLYDFDTIPEDDITFTFTNLYNSILVTTTSTNSSQYYRDGIVFVAVDVHYADGTMQEFSADDWNVSGALLSFSVSFRPDDDIEYIEVFTGLTFTHLVTSETKFTVYPGEYGYDDIGYQLSISIPDPAVGLLDKIKDKMEDVKKKLSDVTTGITDGFKNTVDTLRDLPQKIWAKMETGIQRLFVPDQDTIFSYKDDMEALLAEKLGAIYQVVDVTFDSWDRIQASDDTNTITFPETTINLVEGASFSFGGWEVSIIPYGFEWLATSVKTLCGIVCTILFVNGLRKRYEEIMGVEK